MEHTQMFALQKKVCASWRIFAYHGKFSCIWKIVCASEKMFAHWEKFRASGKMFAQLEKFCASGKLFADMEKCLHDSGITISSSLLCSIFFFCLYDEARFQFPSLLSVNNDYIFRGLLLQLKVPSGQIGSTWDWYYWKSLKKDINRYGYFSV